MHRMFYVVYVCLVFICYFLLNCFTYFMRLRLLFHFYNIIVCVFLSFIFCGLMMHTSSIEIASMIHFSMWNVCTIKYRLDLMQKRKSNQIYITID